AGIGQVIGGNEKVDNGLDHDRAGDFVVVADKDSWFTYYYWTDDAKSPDYARTVDIHKKPGYDPVELFIDPAIKFPMLKIADKLEKKKAGYRQLMDVIPLDATLVKGSHGRIPESKHDWPILVSDHLEPSIDALDAPEVFNHIVKS